MAKQSTKAAKSVSRIPTGPRPARDPFQSHVAGTVSREEIAALAYEHWHARGCPHGTPEQDWLRAEQDLQNRKSAEALTGTADS